MVVLVILAILAAILVPTLLGYIDKARSEKDYATAQTVRVAAQAVVDEEYGKTGKDLASTGFTADMAARALTLAGSTKVASQATDTALKDVKTTVDGKTVYISAVTLGDGTDTTKVAKNEVASITVSIDGKGYAYDSTTNEWSATTIS
ncbi:MAG: type II secretion system GspH family protein [Lachnospiraceae bacterium]|nr:type II secretion system GspH family protein [Lachnospiraceae bacterium]